MYIINNDSSINSELTRSYKDVIRSKGLVKSGSLVNSINLTCILDDMGKCNIYIHCKEYLVYLDDEHKITQTFVNQKVIEDLLGTIVGKYYEYFLNELNDNTNINLNDFEFIFKYVY